MSDWRPSASLSTLAERAALFQQLRSFFSQRGLLEVETPVLSLGTVPDPGIEVFSLPSDDVGGPNRYLQTSPEFAMKRLLAAGAGDIFQMGKAFRQGESGRHHNPEFTLLEWYRVGWNHAELIREVAEMVSEVLECHGWQVWPYRTLFKTLLDIDPFQEQAGLSHWLAVARARIAEVPDNLDRDALLDLLMSHCIEPAIRDWGLVFVTDFPVAQAALARTLQVDGTTVAARFECYMAGRELANGYWEQIDPDALRGQLEAENARRNARGQSTRPLDQRLLAAQRQGLPDCAGVALGVDRLLALKIGANSLSEVISFDWSRA
jgi:lysyl-tRNA synthetase class 2